MALGPKPRDYSQRTPKKMVRLALRSALSDRAAEGRVRVVDFGWDTPKTAQAVTALNDLGLTGKVLVVLRPEDHAVWKSFRNLTDVHILSVGELNAYDVLVADWIVFTPHTVPTAASPTADATTATDGPPAADESTEADVPAEGDAAEAPEEES